MLTMGAFLILLAVVCITGLILAAAVHPALPRYSLAELKRRAKHSEAFTLELDRYELHTGVVTLLRAVRAILVVLTTCLVIGVFGWFLGIILALIIALVYPMAARVPLIQKGAKAFYDAAEPSLLDFVAKFEQIVTAFREPATSAHSKPLQLHSKEELSELIEHSKELVGDKERQLLVSALSFGDTSVGSIMTPKAVIDFIKQSEFLGPLVLDELHGLGHSRLPVIAEDLDHVVGILHLRDMLSLNIRDSTTAAQAMEKKVYYIRQDDTLEHALSAFLKTRHHLFIVINENRETVGLLTLEDVIEALIGRKIVDEDDIHADLRAVAEREGKSNNAAEGHIDI